MHRTSAALLPLCQLPAGSIGLIRQLAGNAAFCQRVREMGFGESASVTKISGSGTILCQINGTRMALSHDAAKNILVEQVRRR
ncbi:FeoA family protein [Opitutus terrae]|uniref:FeoA family protein n=1 Tax=Opitutus terrae (strain DSM 11246 / JCM 15787 / PB90-1) TaxID=452637 RepID=B1ZWN4_OPITP|nr:FeoA family protein [Opitutus terrae]ACB74161.1 FeoA family protein [Opitutus terrae PB90-1]